MSDTPTLSRLHHFRVNLLLAMLLQTADEIGCHATRRGVGSTIQMSVAAAIEQIVGRHVVVADCLTNISGSHQFLEITFDGVGPRRWSARLALTSYKRRIISISVERLRSGDRRPSPYLDAGIERVAERLLLAHQWLDRQVWGASPVPDTLKSSRHDVN